MKNCAEIILKSQNCDQIVEPLYSRSPVLLRTPIAISKMILLHCSSLVGENTEGGEEGTKSVSEATDVKKRKKSAKTKKVRHADQHSTEGNNGHLPNHQSNGSVTLEKLSKDGVSVDTVSPLRPHAYLLNTSSNTEHETTVPSSGLTTNAIFCSLLFVKKNPRQ